MAHPTLMLFHRLSVLLLLLAAAAASKNPRALSSPLGPVVDLGYAAFAGNSTSPTGTANAAVTFFGSIPYAQPPLGNLRFRVPAMLNERAIAREVTDARNWGPACIQRPAVVGIGSEGEKGISVWRQQFHVASVRLLDT
jgi:hypothetical protein